MAHDAALDMLIATIAGAAIPLDAEHAIWRSEDGSHQAMVDLRELAVLEQCRSFATRDRHIAAVTAATGLGSSRAGRLIDELSARKLLTSAASVVARADGGSDPLPQPLMCVRTCNRPASLARLLGSLHASESAHGVFRDLLVIDDTTDATAAQAVCDISAQFARGRAGRVYVIGPAERPALRALLARNEAEAEVLLPLVDPAHPSGRGGARGWNIAVLSAAGRTLAIIDDDIVFDPRLPPGVRAGIELHDSIAAETGMLGTLGAAELEPYPGDPLGELVTDLGHTPGQLLQRHGFDAATLAGRSVEDLAALAPRTRLLGAFTGIHGQLAFDSSIYLNVGAPTRAPQLLCEPFDLTRFEADRIWHGVRCRRLLTHAVYTPLLLDARELLPFAGTWGKADDTLFLALLVAMTERPAFLYSPLLLGHHPPEPRRRLENSRGPLLIDRAAVLARLFDSYATALRGPDRALRLTALGAYAADLARASDDALADIIARQRIALYAQVIDALARTLAQAQTNVPGAWVTHVSDIIRTQRNAMLTLPGLADEITPCRAALKQIASAAQVWPDVWTRVRAQPLLDNVATRLN